jgi:hypothetical protein
MQFRYAHVRGGGAAVAATRPGDQAGPDDTAWAAARGTPGQLSGQPWGPLGGQPRGAGRVGLAAQADGHGGAGHVSAGDAAAVIGDARTAITPRDPGPRG